MFKISSLNQEALRDFLVTEAWLLAMALLPSVIYAFTESLLVGAQMFLLFFVVITASLVYAFWGRLFHTGSKRD